MVAAFGCTAAFDPDCAFKGRDDPEFQRCVTVVGWVHKRIPVTGEWRRMYGWIAGGDFCMCEDPDWMMPQCSFPLTAGATKITIEHDTDDQHIFKTYPPSIVICPDAFEADIKTRVHYLAEDMESVAHCEVKTPKAPMPYVLKVENIAEGGVCKVSNLQWRLGSESDRDFRSIVAHLVHSITYARRACSCIQRPVAPQKFGSECVLAEGFVGDHAAWRYEAVIEAAVEASRPAW